MPTAQHFLKTESFSKLWEHVGLSGAGSSDCLLMYIFLLSLSNTRINDGRIVCLLQTLQSKSMQLPCMNLYPKHLSFLSWCVHLRLISELLVSFHTFINWTTFNLYDCAFTSFCTARVYWWLSTHVFALIWYAIRCFEICLVFCPLAYLHLFAYFKPHQCICSTTHKVRTALEWLY